MKIQDELDIFMSNHHKSAYYNNKKDIETHNFVLIPNSKIFNVGHVSSYIYDSYICCNCNSSVRKVIWQDDFIWNTITCKEMQIKKILE